MSYTQCPQCGEGFGRSLSDICPNCGVELFEGDPDEDDRGAAVQSSVEGLGVEVDGG